MYPGTFGHSFLWRATLGIKQAATHMPVAASGMAEHSWTGCFFMNIQD